MIIISMNLMSIRRWRDSSSSSSSFCSWHTPWGKACLIDYWLIIIWQSHRHRQRPTINLVSPLESVSVMKPMDSRWSTTAWRSLGCRTEIPAVLREEPTLRVLRNSTFTCFSDWAVKSGWVSSISISPLDCAPEQNKYNHGTFRSYTW